LSLIRLQNVYISFDQLPVLREIYFRLSEGDRVGLIGNNGSGKSTLLKLILNELQPDEGGIDINAGLAIGYFSQFSTLEGSQPIQEILDQLFEHVHRLEEELLEVEIHLEEPPEDDDINELLHKQADLLEEMERIDGWNYQIKIDTVLTRLGFTPEYRKRPVESLSGGWRNRAALAKILLQGPDVLLLDEPTNYLDVEGLEWLADWLQAWKGGAIVVSHDRHFLNRVVNRIVEIENYHLQEYEGNFTEYVRQKPMRLKALERQFQHEEELLVFESFAIREREELERNPNKYLHRKLAEIKKQVEPPLVDRIITGIYSGMAVSEVLCRVESLSKRYGEQVLFRDLTFEIHRGDRIVVMGPNGCGKSTLLRALTESEMSTGECLQVKDRAYDSGEVRWLKGSSWIHYNDVFEHLNLDDTVSHAVNVVGLAFLAQRKKVNQFLSLFRFSESDLNQKIGTLSGGQRARVALAQCLLSGAPVILLDEPTNHLDLTSTQVMERALLHFPGAIVVVSHDRFFIDKIATRLLVFQEKGWNSSKLISVITGNYTLWKMNQNLVSTEST